MHGWVNVCVGCLLVVAWAYGRLSYARGPLPIGLRGFKPRQRPSRSTTNKQTTHTLNQPTMLPIIHPFNHPYVYSPTHSFTQPFIHPPFHSSTIRLSTHPLIHPFSHPNNPLSIHPPIYPPVHTSIHPPIQTTLHRSIHPFTQMQPYSISPDRKIIASNHRTGSYRNTINTQRLTHYAVQNAKFILYHCHHPSS